MGVDNFEQRLARLGAKPASGSPQVEFITVPPVSRRKGSWIGVVLALGLVLALAAKGLLLAQVGEAGLDRMRQDLAEGSLWQRGLAFVLYPDPVSFVLAQQFGLPGPENSAAMVRLNHDSDVTLIEVEPSQGGD